MSTENDHENASLTQLKCMALTDALTTLVRETNHWETRRQALNLMEKVAEVARGITAIGNQIVE